MKIPASVQSYTTALRSQIAEIEREVSAEEEQISAWRKAISLSEERMAEANTQREKLGIELESALYIIHQFEMDSLDGASEEEERDIDARSDAAESPPESLTDHILTVMHRVGSPLSARQIFELTGKRSSVETVGSRLSKLCKQGLIEHIGTEWLARPAP